jgi:hypothetical protein
LSRVPAGLVVSSLAGIVASVAATMSTTAVAPWLRLNSVEVVDVEIEDHPAGLVVLRLHVEAMVNNQ